MQKSSDYRRNAEECRKLARAMGAPDDQRDQLLRMAETWEALATERERQSPRQIPDPAPADTIGADGPRLGEQVGEPGK